MLSRLFFVVALAIAPGLSAMAQTPQQPSPSSGAQQQQSAKPSPPAPKAHRLIPDNNLAYPVLVLFKGSEGSGFFLFANSGFYLVTAKHVLFDKQTKQLRDKTMQLLFYSKEPQNPEENVAILDLEALEKGGNIKW